MKPKSDATQEFARWFRRVAENQLMTMREVARKAGLSEMAIYSFANGRMLPRRGLTIVKLARALSVPREVIEAKLSGQIAA